MELLHIMHLASARSAALERMINDILGAPVVAWDSGLVHEFYVTRWRSGPFVTPALLVGTWATVIFVAIIGTFTALCKLLAPQEFWYWSIPVWTASVYHIVEWAWLVTARKSKIETVAFSAVQSNFPRTH